MKITSSKIRRSHSRALAPALLFAPAFALAFACASPRAPAQTTATPLVLSSSNATVTLPSANDNFRVAAGALINVASGNGITGGTRAASQWFVRNSGTVIGASSGMNFTFLASVTNDENSLIQGNGTGSGQSGILFTSAAAGVCEIMNSGTILSTTLCGIDFGATGGYLLNNLTGVVRGATQGVQVTSNDTLGVLIDNAGFITGGSSAMYFSASGTVINRATGLIANDGAATTQGAVYFNGASSVGRVENSGTIIGQAKGVNLGATAGASIVVNNAGGLIQANLASGANGAAVFVSGPALIDNAGEIHGAGAALYLAGGAACLTTATNTGTITSANDTAVVINTNNLLANSGLINGATYGVTASVAGTLQNSGAIIGATGGAYFTASASVSNAAGALIQGDITPAAAPTSAGIRFTSGAGILDNSGAIVGSSGVYGGIHTEITNNEGGLIQGTGAASSASAIFFTSAATGIITNSGVIRGLLYGINANGAGMQIINNPTGEISSDTSRAINNGSSGDGLFIENSGSILGATSGVYFVNTGTLINHATGLISGNSTSSAQGAVYSSGNVSITNAGVIRGAGPGINSVTAPITLENTGTIIAGNGAAIALLATAATAASSLALDDGSQVTGDIVSAAAGLNTITLAGAGTVSGNIIGSAGNAALGVSTLTMNGADWTITGTVQLSAADPAALNVATGRLALLNDTILADPAGGVTIAAGGTLQIGGNTATGSLLDSTLAATPAILDNGALVISRSDDTTFTGALTGSGDFIKAGDGALDITAANLAALTGNTAILDGNLIATAATANGAITLANNATITFHQDTDATLSGLITGDGNLIKNGAGLLDLANTANNYTGATTVNTGTLQGAIGQGTLTVNAGATYKVADGITNFSISGILGSGTIDLNASSLIFNVAAGATDAFAFTGALTSSNPLSVLTKTGGGTLVLQSAANLSGGADIEQGTLSLADQTLISAPVLLGTGSTYGLIDYTNADTNATPWTLDITLNGSPTSATLTGGGFTVTDPAQTQTLAIAVNGAGAFIKDGDGALDITGATMNNTGNTAVLNGNLIATAATAKGNITLANSSTITFEQATDATIAGLITGAGNLVKNGAGLLDLTNTANAYTGDTTVNSGTLQGAIGAGTLTVNTGATYKVADGVADFSLTGILGAGTIDLNAANLTFNVASGASVFNFTGALTGGNQLIKTGAGTLDLQTAAALTNGVAVKDGTLLLSDLSRINAPVTLGDATTTGLIDYTGPAAWNKNITLTGAGGGFVVDTGTQTLAAATTVTGAGDFVKAGAGALNITAATMNNTGNTAVLDGNLIATAATAKGAITLANNSTITFQQDTDATLSGLITGDGNLVKNGAGLLNLTNTSNNYAGNTTVNSGTLQGAIGAGTLTVNTGATYKVADGVTDFSLTGVLGAGTINLNAANLTFNVASGTSVFNFTGALTGGNQLIKTGAGTLVMQTAAALANGAQIQDGTLLLDNLSLINAPITLGSAATSTTPATAAFIAYTGAAPWNKNLSLAGAGGGFTVDNAATTLQLAPAATVTGAADFIKTGAGALDITAATMNNTGNTRVLDGTLIATAATAKGAITLAAPTATLEIVAGVAGASSTQAGQQEAPAPATLTGAITGFGKLIKTGAGTLTLANANNNYTGGTELREGSLAGSAAALQGDISTAANTTVIFNQTTDTGDATYSGVITGAGTLEKTGPAKLTLTAAYPDAIPVTVTAGALQGNAANLRGNITLAAATAAIVFDQATDATYAGIITGAGSFEKTGAGALTLTAAQTYAGDTRVTAGILRPAASNLLSPASAITLAGGTLDIGRTTQQARGLFGGDGALAITAAFNPATGLLTEAGKLTATNGVVGNINLRITFAGSLDAGGSQSLAIIDAPNPAAATYNITYDNRAVLGNRDLVFSPDIGMLVPQYSPEILSAVVLPSLARLMGKAGIDTLQQRLGDLRRQRSTNIAYTVRGIYREDDLSGPLFGALKIRTAGAQAAASWSITNAIDPKKGRLDMGLLVTAVQADANYRDQADIDATSREGGLYVTYTRGIWYADLLANIARNEYDVRLRDGSGTLNCTGFSPSFSFETGWSINLGRDFGSIEPQGQVIFQHHQINHSVDLFDRDYNFASTDSLVTRASLLWRTIFKTTSGAWTLVPYARASIGREFRGNQRLVVDDEPFTNDMRGVETTFEGGLTVRVSNLVSIYGSSAWTRSSNVSSTSVTGGLRFRW